MQSFNSDMKAEKANSVLFFLSTINWWFDAPKRIEKIIWKNAFEQKKKKPRLKFNHWSALIGLRITGPWRVMNINSYNMSSLLTPSLTTAICHYFITTNNVFITADRHPSSMTDVSLSNLVKWQLQLLRLKKVIF